jgi:hypothetical protein
MIYALRLQVGASQAMHVLVEIHHLEAIELLGDRLNLLLLSGLDLLYAFSIPLHVFRHFGCWMI